ncbi:MAG: Fur family transcriptional regulator [Bacillota bacterium]
MATETKKRMTKQRKKILEVLKSTTCHPTADWIYEQVKKDIPNISLGTVYRNLNVLAEMDEIMVLEYGSNYSRFDGNPEEHYHFHCEQCNSVHDIDIDLNEKLNKKINDNTEFKAFDHRLEFYGICPECQNQNE